MPDFFRGMQATENIAPEVHDPDLTVRTVGTLSYKQKFILVVI